MFIPRLLPPLVVIAAAATVAATSTFDPEACSKRTETKSSFQDLIGREGMATACIGVSFVPKRHYVVHAAKLSKNQAVYCVNDLYSGDAKDVEAKLKKKLGGMAVSRLAIGSSTQVPLNDDAAGHTIYYKRLTCNLSGRLEVVGEPELCKRNQQGETHDCSSAILDTAITGRNEVAVCLAGNETHREQQLQPSLIGGPASGVTVKTVGNGELILAYSHKDNTSKRMHCACEVKSVGDKLIHCGFQTVNPQERAMKYIDAKAAIAHTEDVRYPACVLDTDGKALEVVDVSGGKVKVCSAEKLKAGNELLQSYRRVDVYRQTSANSVTVGEEYCHRDYRLFRNNEANRKVQRCLDENAKVSSVEVNYDKDKSDYTVTVRLADGSSSAPDTRMDYWDEDMSDKRFVKYCVANAKVRKHDYTRVACEGMDRDTQKVAYLEGQSWVDKHRMTRHDKLSWVASCVRDSENRKGLSYRFEGCVDSADNKVLPVGSCRVKAGGSFKCCGFQRRTGSRFGFDRRKEVTDGVFLPGQTQIVKDINDRRKKEMRFSTKSTYDVERNEEVTYDLDLAVHKKIPTGFTKSEPLELSTFKPVNMDSNKTA